MELNYFHTLLRHEEVLNEINRYEKCVVLKVGNQGVEIFPIK